MAELPEDLRSLQEALDANEQEARTLVSGLSEADGTWQPAAGSWSVAQCLDHLAAGNRLYVDAWQEPAARARAAGRLRRRPANPGLVGGLFVRSLEPPVTRKMRSPRTAVPRASPPLADAASAFFASHARIVEFLQRNADLDLAGVRFPNPFVRGLRFSLATGLHVLAAHERRHLWQAWNVSRAR
jgi:DinB superfamily